MVVLGFLYLCERDWVGWEKVEPMYLIRPYMVHVMNPLHKAKSRTGHGTRSGAKQEVAGHPAHGSSLSMGVLAKIRTVGKWWSKHGTLRACRHLKLKLRA